MSELPIIIKMNISHYEAMLKTDRTPEQRANIERMLTEAKAALASATRQSRPRPQSDWAREV